MAFVISSPEMPPALALARTGPSRIWALAGIAAASSPATTPRAATDRLMVVLSMTFPSQVPESPMPREALRLPAGCPLFSTPSLPTCVSASEGLGAFTELAAVSTTSAAVSMYSANVVLAGAFEPDRLGLLLGMLSPFWG